MGGIFYAFGVEKNGVKTVNWGIFRGKQKKRLLEEEQFQAERHKNKKKTA